MSRTYKALRIFRDGLLVTIGLGGLLGSIWVGAQDRQAQRQYLRDWADACYPLQAAWDHRGLCKSGDGFVEPERAIPE